MTDSDEFRKFGKAMIDYVGDYFDNVKDRRVIPSVKPGYLRDLIPSKAPQEPENWEDVLKDVENCIMPGVTHWSHPNFHAYFTTGVSYPAIVADILAGALSGPGFTWISQPASTELEMIVMDWLADMLGLPEHFKFTSKNSTGGGVIQGYASDATYYALLLARARIIGKNCEKMEKLPYLVMYASKQSHSSAQKSALLAGIRINYIETDDNFVLNGAALEKAIESDRAEGLIPFYLCATLGTTTSCAFDNIKELGPICNKEGIWLHVDAAYAGTAFICDEYRHLMEGIECVDSFCFNPHKWMLTTIDCSVLWVKDRLEINDTFNVDPTYLRYPVGSDLPQYRHWQIPLGRKFRSLKLWFVLRMYGVKGLQRYIRNHIKLAKEFESLLISDDRFEISYPVTMGLVCFRLKGSNESNEKLNAMINSEGKIHITPSRLGDLFILRLVVSYEHSTIEHIQFAFDTISKNAELVLKMQS